jgi:replicative DNA helicase
MSEAEQKPITIPTSYATAAEQVREAQEEIMHDYGQLARLPWANVEELVGQPLPRDIWVVGARPGNGKTTFLLGLFDALVRAGWRTLYIGAGSEGPPKDLRRQWAALRCGFQPAPVLENRWGLLPTTPHPRGGEPLDPKTRVFIDLQDQATHHHETAHFFDAQEKLTTQKLVEAMNYATKNRCQYVILDHIHRMRFDARSDERRSLSETTRWMRDMLAKYDMTGFVAAQLHRGASDKGPLRDLIPPTMDDLKGTGTLEEDAVVGLLLHRTRRADVSAKDVADVVKNVRPVSDIIEPNTMCVRVGKHRRRGHVKDHCSFLSVGVGLTARASPYAKHEREPGEDDLPF